MTRVQRARAKRLGYLLGASLALLSGSAWAYKPSKLEKACEERAWLHYAMAESVGLDADKVWEDTIEVCLHGRPAPADERYQRRGRK